jgi:hypothetical protein
MKRCKQLMIKHCSQTPKKCWKQLAKYPSNIIAQDSEKSFLLGAAQQATPSQV